MIINLNGWPGVGKLTIGRELAKLLAGNLLDNHTLLNLGKALAKEGEEDYYRLVRAVRSTAFEYILRMPASVPIVLTNVVAQGGTSGFLEENWQAVIDLAKARGSSLYSVILTCSIEENSRRIVAEDRELLKKQRDPSLLTHLAITRTLFDEGATFRTTIDNTKLSPQETAAKIKSWIAFQD